MRYGGTKALDAEIKIDFSSNEILMDYSTVKGFARYDSNHSVFLKDDWKAQLIHVRLAYILWQDVIHLIMPVFALYQIYFTWLVACGVIRSADAMYDHQRLMQYIYTFKEDIWEKSVSGPLETKALKFMVPNNLFLGYKLTGQYREKVKAISLTRRYLKRKQFGVFERIQQQGWWLTFEFTDPPQEGSCTVDFV
jgi:hypothetical protein